MNESRGAVGSETRPTRARLFAALALPEAVRVALAAWRGREVGGIEALRAVPAEALHVTLCFLGSLPVSDIGAVARACAKAAAGFPAVLLETEGAVWLPARRPTVLAVRLGDRGPVALREVQAALSTALAAGGFYVPERRPFLAHVTVARARRDARMRPVELAAPGVGPFSGDRVVLYRSRPGPGGSRYEELSTVALRPACAGAPSGS